MARGLTPQQKAFAADIAVGKCTARDAAIAAGYSPRSADAQASMLLKNPKVKAEVERIQAKAAVQAVGSKEELLNMIWQEVCDAHADCDRINFFRGSELWLKATGQLVEKREIKQAEVVELDWSAPIGEDGDAG